MPTQKKKRLTLNETWEFCLAMWKWIVKRTKAGDKRDVIDLKRIWSRRNGYNVRADCFFCAYIGKNGCSDCPAILVDKTFCCNNNEYNYETNPIAFYTKLVELNKKRLAKK